jgi:serine/threonine-protein kinase PknG
MLDGYCDVCGMAAGPPASAGAAVEGAAVADGTGRPSAANVPVSTRTSTSALGSAPMGTMRSTASRPTRRLSGGAGASRLGAGLTTVPAVPVSDPIHSLMDPPMVAEEKRFCSVCQTAVGRGRGAAAGRSKGFCAQCRTPFDFEPKLQPGMLLGGQYEVAGCLAHGGMGWIYLARDRNVNDRWVVLKGLLNSGDPDAVRAAVAEKQFLAEVEHPLIVEIYNFVTAADGASYIVMEYVGGRSLNNMLKERMKAAGRFSPIPVDQAVAFIVEILPAFSYLHGMGLLYCDFKPANMIQVGDALKLIDLGGVRRTDDDQSPIYGTVGFQAPEVAKDGCTVASDLFTVARTLATLVFEFKGYQSTFEFTLPAADAVPLFAQHDSLYRWLLKGTARRPEDRFQTADEMRTQLLGVLTEVTAAAAPMSAAVTRSVPSGFFQSPSIIGDELGWKDMPRLVVDRTDPMADWLASITSDVPADRLRLLAAAPEVTPAVAVEQAMVALHLDDTAQANELANTILSRDPWEWRGVWLHGLAALHAGDHGAAVSAFNSVYGQLPGELAPKLALARACELHGEQSIAAGLYRVCGRTDVAYVGPAQFGLARLALSSRIRADALHALDRIPQTSRAYGEARRQRALLLAAALEPDRALEDLDQAARELDRATMSEWDRAKLRIDILRSAAATVSSAGVQPNTTIAGVLAEPTSLAAELERAYRSAADLAPTRQERYELVDRANAVRPLSLR